MRDLSFAGPDDDGDGSGCPRRPRPVVGRDLREPKPAPAADPTGGMTPGQKWRYRRNVVICLAHEHGLSQRFLADVFDLPRSRVGAIVDEFKQKYSGEASPTE